MVVELGLQQGGVTGDSGDRYFRLIPTFIRYAGPKRGWLQAIGTSKRNIAINAEFSLLDGTANEAFSVNLGEWPPTSEEGVSLNSEALSGANAGDIINGLEVAGPWFTLKGSGTSQRPFNVKFSIIETKSASKLAKLFSDELEARKADLKTEIISQIRPTPLTLAEQQSKDTAAKTARDTLCQTWIPKMEAFKSGTGAFTVGDVTDFNVALETYKVAAEGTSYEADATSIADLKSNQLSAVTGKLDNELKLKCPG